MTSRRRRLAAAVAAAALVVMAGVAGPERAWAQSFPRLTAPVNDFAKIIDPQSAQELDRRIRALETRTRDAVVVVTVDTIAPSGSIEDYALKLFEQAGIGQRERDTGLLILVARTERQVRVEVGYDLEEFITDGFAGDVIRQQMLPAFKQGNYGVGLVASATRIINRIAERRGVTLDDVPAAPANDREGGGAIAGFLPIALIVIFLIIAAVSRANRGPRFRGPRFPWGGFGGPFGGIGGGVGGFGGFGRGGGGGGFGGFGGGMSGGGGASGRW